MKYFCGFNARILWYSIRSYIFMIFLFNLIIMKQQKLHLHLFQNLLGNSFLFNFIFNFGTFEKVSFLLLSSCCIYFLMLTNLFNSFKSIWSLKLKKIFRPCWFYWFFMKYVITQKEIHACILYTYHPKLSTCEIFFIRVVIFIHV